MKRCDGRTSAHSSGLGMRDFSVNAGFFLGFLASFAFAGETAVSLLAVGMPADCAEFGSVVSRSEGNFRSISPIVNGVRCYGAFQFCDSGTLQAYWQGTAAEFLANPAAQVSAWLRYAHDEWGKAIQLGMTNMIGQQVCYQGTCAVITQSSILMACQFGCSKGGKLYNLMKSGLNCNSTDTKDGAGTSVCTFLISGSGYNVSCVTKSNDGIDCLPVTTAKNE